MESAHAETLAETYQASSSGKSQPSRARDADLEIRAARGAYLGKQSESCRQAIWRATWCEKGCESAKWVSPQRAVAEAMNLQTRFSELAWLRREICRGQRRAARG